MRLLLAALFLASPLSAQIRIAPGFAVGPAIPMGDIGRVSEPSLGGNAYLLAGIPGERFSLGLEFQYQQFDRDSLTLVDPIVSIPVIRLRREAWTGLGAMIRYEFNITRSGLYAVGGGGMYFTRAVPRPEEENQEITRSHDFTLLGGVGYRLLDRINLEVRLVNIFTVNDSERWMPITIGFRF